MNNNLINDPIFSKLIKNTFFITGAARSGTSILGKIIGSMKNVEYVYEPPFLSNLIPLFQNKIDPTQNYLFESYFYEDIIVNSISGRYMNFKSNEESYILNSKSQHEIKKRLSADVNKEKILSNLKNYHFAFKLPHVVHKVNTLNSIYPNMKNLIIYRSSKDVIQSLMNKKWFTNKNILNIYPKIKFKDKEYPFWLSPEFFNLWFDIDESDRCGIYFYEMYKNLKNIDKKKSLLINYKLLVTKTNEEINKITTFTGLKKTSITKKIISELKLPKSYSNKIIKMDTKIIKLLDNLDNIYA